MSSISTGYTRFAITGVERPGRYLGLEYNRPAFHGSDIKVCLVFPDLYDIGISYYGFQILYHLLNRIPGVQCERAYLPWGDMQEWLIRKHEPLASVETGRALRQFDILGFTLQTELHYPGVLKVLDLAGIPRYAEKRNRQHPIVLGGGPSAFHPEPVAPFFDAFLLGDGEEAFPQIIEQVRSHLPRQADDELLWQALAGIAGVYVPRFYTPSAENPARIIAKDGSKQGITSRIVTLLKPDYYPEAPLVPMVRGEHDRLTIEIMRGCTQGCRFCQAGMLNRPVRERPVSEIVEQVLNGLRLTGMDEVGLLSLSTSDYSHLTELLGVLADRLRGTNATLAFPSLRPSSFTEEMARINTGGKKTSFTFAVEAGSERLRRVINKNLSEEQLLTAVERAYRNGWKTIKLYFMIGLPTENEEDIEIGSRLLQNLMRNTPRHRELHLSVAPFIPKPHTVFENEPFYPLEELQRRYRAILRGLDRHWVKRSGHDAERSQIEALLTRGDRRLARVIEQVADEGFGFESWGGEFSYNRWVTALKSHHPEWEYDLERRNPSEPKAWDHLSNGITTRFKLEEANLAYSGEERPDCREGECYTCGLIKVCNQVRKSHPPVIIPTANPQCTLQERLSTHSDQPAVTIVRKKKYRVYYAKLGKARYVGHHDLQRSLERGLRRAGVPLIYTEGYSPHPKLSFSPAIPLGYGAIRMWLDFESAIELEPAEWLGRFRKTFPTGVRPYALSSDVRGDEEEPCIRTYRLLLNGALPENIADRISNERDPDMPVEAIRIEPHRRIISIQTKPPKGGGVRPEEAFMLLTEKYGIDNVDLVNITRIT